MVIEIAAEGDAHSCHSGVSATCEMVGDLVCLCDGSAVSVMSEDAGMKGWIHVTPWTMRGEGSNW